jgi:hypothetical protein
MPLMSAKVHPMAQVFSLEHLFNPFAMIIGSILLSVKVSTLTRGPVK